MFIRLCEAIIITILQTVLAKLPKNTTKIVLDYPFKINEIKYTSKHIYDDCITEWHRQLNVLNFKYKVQNYLNNTFSIKSYCLLYIIIYFII